ncbi:ADP-ribosylation factor-binding protein GGA2-like isoform X2 [Anolis sagrei]|uniref:ADP-ribosylation factor-binding protein GGA2-like isoform X2 n=1 Tax=Anolis sagrei TaxID=38937 RepID=UPI00352083AA
MHYSVWPLHHGLISRSVGSGQNRTICMILGFALFFGDGGFGNRLCWTIQEQEKSAKVSRRMNAIKEAHNSAVALEEMLRRNKAMEEPAMEALQELHAKCEKLKSLMFRVASETVEDEEALALANRANKEKK